MGGGPGAVRRFGLVATACGVVLSGLVLGTANPAAASSKSHTTPTVWLCNPTKRSDPCAGNRTATSVTASNATSTVVSATSSNAQKFDCFYVYPTVSSQPGLNANLVIQGVEVAAAREQASRFSQVCRVWAPMYRQRTLGSLLRGGLGGNAAANNIAYDGVLSAWKDYLAHDNHGRPIIFIGHSQGAAILIRLLKSQIDPSASLRKKMVSAIILGGNVQVPTGKTVGGSFSHIPVCASAASTGCVIAYSSFNTKPPADTLFGRPGQGVSLQANQTKSSGQQVVCVNPVDFSSAPAASTPYFLTGSAEPPGLNVSTPWVTFPNLYTVTCAHSGTATWLQVSVINKQGDIRPVVQPQQGPTWGLHVDDVNLTLGNLVLDVAYQEAAFK
jgi:DUF3089 family protein